MCTQRKPLGVSKESITLGVYVGGSSVEAVSSRGHETVIGTQATHEPDAWLELILYGISLDSGQELRGAFTFGAGASRELEFNLRRKARSAGFHMVLIVPATTAAREGLSGELEAEVPLIVLHPERSQLGVGERFDWVRPIAGREARELAVSLRCMLKSLSPAQRRERLRRVVVVGSEEVVDAFGRRAIEDELRGIGARKIEFRYESLSLARGALALGQQTPRTLWRRVARQ